MAALGNFHKRLSSIGMFTLLVIVLILPLTISALNKQQQTQQQAAGTGYPPGDGNILWNGDWETGDTSQWSIHAGGHWGNSSVTVVTSPVRQGTYAGKLTLNPTSGASSARAEISSSQQNTGGYPGQEWYYSWSAYFPSNPDKTTGWGQWNDFTQWMDMRHNCSPPLQFDVSPGLPDYIDISNIINPQQSGNCTESVHKSYKLINLIYDQWIDFTVHIKWSEDPTVGFAEVWVNGQHLLPKTYMQTLDPGSTGVYMEQAMYRPNPPGTDIIYLDATRRHDAYAGGTISMIPSNPPVSQQPTSSQNTCPVLSVGSNGPDVATLQTLLTKAGFDTQGIDGIFGPITQSALNNFKQSKGLTSDGIVDTATWQALGVQCSPPTGISGTSFAVTLLLHGIGQGGDNVNAGSGGTSNPLHQSRNITVSVLNNSNQVVAIKQGSVVFDSSSGSFKGSIGMGNVTNGNYLIRIKTDGFLSTQIPGIIAVSSSQQNISLPSVSLVTGEINNDDQLDILDYNILIGCFGSKQTTTSCTAAPTTSSPGADINDDGHVDGVDYNLFLRELSVQKGVGGPTPIPSGNPTSYPTPTAAQSGVKHYEYVANDGSLSVYDIDNNFIFVKKISLPQTSDGIRGIVGHSGNHALYISHGSDSTCCGSLLKLDLQTDQIVYDKKYNHGIDSPAISPNGTKLYQPAGEAQTSNNSWYVVDEKTGNDIGSINGPSAPHNTIVSLNGQHVYMGGRQGAYLEIADVSSNLVTKKIGPLQSGTVRPFTITGKETFAYTTATGFLGFQVSDINAQKVLYTVDLTKLGFPFNPSGFPATTPSHGIAMSPDEKYVAVIDVANAYVHIFDVTGIPSSAPKKIGDIKFTRTNIHNESPCAYDCLADGWLEWSRDGRFIFVGDEGDVIDTLNWNVIKNLDTLYNTRKMLEVDFQNNQVFFVPTNRQSVGFVTQ